MSPASFLLLFSFPQGKLLLRVALTIVVNSFANFRHEVSFQNIYYKYIGILKLTIFIKKSEISVFY